jgi:hypothetical protein
MAPRYKEASHANKILLLDTFVAITGYARKYAIHLLNHAEVVQQAHRRSHLRRYGPEVQHALFLVWNAAQPDLYQTTHSLSPYLDRSAGVA